MSSFLFGNCNIVIECLIAACSFGLYLIALETILLFLVKWRGAVVVVLPNTCLQTSKVAHQIPLAT